MAQQSLKTGGQILVETLRTQGVGQVFCVPGESYLAVLDALHDTAEIGVTVCRQEGGAAMMADAYGKLTGEPGICFVTRGPGATNASAGVHIAQQDSTPMILFVGQVARGDQEREAFQEIDYRRMYGQLAKWVAQIDDARRIPEFVSRAFHTAVNGRPGPVVLALPEDMLTERVEAPEIARYARVESHPGAGDLARLRDLLARAERPFLLLGGGGWNAAARADLQRFAAAWELPVGVSFRCQDYLDNESANYVGDVGIGINPALAARVREADLLLVLGARLGEMTTGGYTLVDIPTPRQTLVHIHPGAEELGRVYQPALAINAGLRAAAAALAELRPDNAPAWGERTRAARAEYLAWSAPVTAPGAVQMAEIVTQLRAALPPEAIICNGAGNYAAWLHRFFRYRGYRTQLAPTSGSMGYGTPAAVAAKRIFPERPVIALAGDGCFIMHGQELATAVQYDLPIVVLVVNNGMYGTIRMHQERHYPGRISATTLKNPDFVKLAEAYGAYGECVRETAAFAPALARALAAGRPALIEIRLDPEAISPRESLSQIREKALALKV
jgi:acetolactate synthase-1/2/3 large subunit